LIFEAAQQHFVDILYDDVLLPDYVVQLVFQYLVILFYPSNTVIYVQGSFLATLPQRLVFSFWFLFFLFQKISLFRQKVTSVDIQ